MLKSFYFILMEELEETKYFSIIVDLNHYVLQSSTPVERFLSFIPMTSNVASLMLEIVINKLKELRIDNQDCRGKSNDNVSKMSGIYNGLPANIKQLNLLTDYSPCAAHSLNLIDVHAAESLHALVDFFQFLQDLYKFFSASTRRWVVLIST